MKHVPLLLVAALCCITPVSAHAADSRADFLKLIDRPLVPLSPKVEALPVTMGLAQFHFTFAADKEQRVPGVLVKSKGSHGRRPVVIVLHGTGGNKQRMLPLCRKLARLGFIAVAIDGRYHGERTKAGSGTVEYCEAIVRAWRDGREHPFYYDTVWDMMRLLDYLETRDDVDPKRIGLIGFSKGGIETYLTAAVDERIAVAVPCVGVQSFHWALENNDWRGRIGTIQPAFNTIAKEAGVTKPDSAFVQKFYDRVVPGIYGEFDGPTMLPLIAPRPLFIINGDSDDHTPLPSVNACTYAALAAYKAAGADDHFLVRIQVKTGHKVTATAERKAVKWFVKWLKP